MYNIYVDILIWSFAIYGMYCFFKDAFVDTNKKHPEKICWKDASSSCIKKHPKKICSKDTSGSCHVTD